jgi:polyisoprenoid-binding protein YceI
MSVTEITTALPTTGTYVLDRGHTHVGFKVRHLMVSKVRGQFGDFAGTITIGDEPLESSVEVTVQLASIATGDEQRDGHLRNSDFFDVEKNETMTFRSTGVRQVGPDAYDVDGELSLLGVTKPLTLHVEFNGTSADPWGGQRVGFTATAQLDREEFGLTWNASLETGGVVVGKRIDIEIEAEAVLQA